MRVHEATIKKKGAGKQQPYLTPQTGACTQRDPPLKHSFRVDLVNRAPTRISYDVFDIKRYQGESLKEFLNWFGVQVVRLKSTHEAMTVHACIKGMLSGPFTESLLRFYPKTFSKIRRGALTHIVADDQVIEKRGLVGPVRLRAAGRPQPMRVHKATIKKKGAGKQQPYLTP